MLKLQVELDEKEWEILLGILEERALNTRFHKMREIYTKIEESISEQTGIEG